MTPEQSLQALEQQLAGLAAALLAADAPRAAQHGSALRAAAARLAQALESSPGPSLWASPEPSPGQVSKPSQEQPPGQAFEPAPVPATRPAAQPLPAHWQQRSRAIAAMLCAQRAGLARLCALTDRQLHNLLAAPGHAMPTYHGHGLVTHATAQPRIYRAAG